MKIGIVVHSFTGNTYSVAQKLKESLTKKGHNVTLEKIEVLGGEQQNALNFELAKSPDISTYDAVIFGAPVRGCNLSPVMSKYLSGISSLAQKKVLCFCTMAFPFKWMGGKNAIKKMTLLSGVKNGKVLGTGIISWSNKGREANINALVSELSQLVG